MSHLFCYCSKHKHFGLSHIRLWRRSLIKSVKVAMVVSVCLNLQQSYNFRKIQQENAKWNGAVIYIWHFTVCFPAVTPQ